MAEFNADSYDPFWDLPQMAPCVPSVKTHVPPANMSRINEDLSRSSHAGMSILKMLEKTGLHVWKVVKKVAEFLKSKFMCARDTKAITGEVKKSTVGLEAQERPGLKAIENEDLSLSLHAGRSILNMLEKTGLHLRKVMKKVIHRCVNVAVFIKSKTLFMCARDTKAMTGECKKSTVGLEAQERPGLEAIQEEACVNDGSDDDEDDEDMEEQSSLDEEDEAKWTDEEESDWSDDEKDSEASAESTELWESFLNGDPDNPLYFSCTTGVKTSNPSKVETSGDEEEHSPKANTQERTKKVCFSHEVIVHNLVVWSFASRKARDGSCWLQLARDRERFRRRVEKTGEVLSPCLTSQHRARVWDRLQREAQPELC